MAFQLRKAHPAMTPEQRNTCRAIEREGKKINDEINVLRAEERAFQDERRLINDTIVTNKREIAELQRDLATACLPSPRRRRERPSSDVGDGLGIIDCIARVERIRRSIAEREAKNRELVNRLRDIARELETRRRQIAGKEALFPILRRQKAEAGCP